MNSSELGFAYECYALAYLLKAKQFEFIGFQLSLGGVSVDLLMQSKNSLLIIEVKSAARGFFYSDRVGKVQEKRLKRAAQFLRRSTQKSVLVFEMRVRWGEIPQMWPVL